MLSKFAFGHLAGVASLPPRHSCHGGLACGNTKGYSSTYLAMGFADARAGTQKIVVLLSTRPNTSESHSETSTRVPFCIAKTGRRGRCSLPLLPPAPPVRPPRTRRSCVVSRLNGLRRSKNIRPWRRSPCPSRAPSAHSSRTLHMYVEKGDSHSITEQQQWAHKESVDWVLWHSSGP